MTVQLAIIKAFETKLKEFDEFSTEWENSNFKPVNGEAYQKVNTLFAEPENPTMGDGFWRQRGIFQVQLRYPSNKGKADIFVRARALQLLFARGLSVVADGITSIVEKTPEVSNGSKDDDRYIVTIRVRFYADIFD